MKCLFSYMLLHLLTIPVLRRNYSPFIFTYIWIMFYVNRFKFEIWKLKLLSIFIILVVSTHNIFWPIPTTAEWKIHSGWFSRCFLQHRWYRRRSVANGSDASSNRIVTKLKDSRIFFRISLVSSQDRWGIDLIQIRKGTSNRGQAILISLNQHSR